MTGKPGQKGGGGRRPGAGRKPKSEEEEVKAALRAASAVVRSENPEAARSVWHALQEAALVRKESWAITLSLAYEVGKPKEKIDLRTGKILELEFEHDGAVADIAGTETGPEANHPGRSTD